jgi:hypothetical protein
MNFRDAQQTIPLLPFTVNRESQQAQGLIAWWPIMNDHGGNNIRCMIDTRNGGAISSGSQAWGGSDFGFPAAAFSSSGGHQVTGFAQALGDFTVSVWFHPQDTDTHGRIVDKTESTGFMMARNSFNDDSFRASIQSTNVATLTIINHRPHLGVLRRTGTTGILSFDGLSTSGSAVVGNTVTSTDAFKIGGGANSATQRIWDVRIYNRALSDHEVNALFDPSTRYDLFYPLGQKFYSFSAAAAAATNRNQIIVIG